MRRPTPSSSREVNAPCKTKSAQFSFCSLPFTPLPMEHNHDHDHSQCGHDSQLPVSGWDHAKVVALAPSSGPQDAVEWAQTMRKDHHAAVTLLTYKKEIRECLRSAPVRHRRSSSLLKW